MPACGTLLAHSLHMRAAAIALVMRKAVGRINKIKALHDPVTGNLRDNRSCGNRCAQRITVHHGFNLHIGNLHRHCVNQRCLRLAVQVFQHLRHALLRCDIDIQLINIADADDVHLDIQRLGHNLVIQHIAFSSGKLLGIVQIQDFTVARQNDRTCDHRARQRASSDLVDAADPAKILIFVLVDLHLFRALTLFF